MPAFSGRCDLSLCYFVSDLHGKTDRYTKLFDAIRSERPDAVFIGGDILTAAGGAINNGGDFDDFLEDFLIPEFRRLDSELGDAYPDIYIILGNDDGRGREERFIEIDRDERLWRYAHNRRLTGSEYTVYGYSFIPPSPYPLKDFERYDVSRYVDPGCVSPEDGSYSVPVSEQEKRYRTIKKDLEELVEKDDLSRSIFLFHSPPYKTALDRADLDGRTIDYVPVDVHVGSIAIQRFIESRQPMLTLHGHVHEAAEITGRWKEKMGRTWMFNAAHSGPELALVVFSPEELDSAERRLI